MFTPENVYATGPAPQLRKDTTINKFIRNQGRQRAAQETANPGVRSF
jgi:hypothetical protein